jgi:predicted aspartyl protease
MLGEDMKMPQLKPRYFRGKLDNHFQKFVEVVRRLSINMPLLVVLQVPTYSHYFKDILANKYEIATLWGGGCPMIQCSIGSFKFEKALCDLGASVSVIPRDVYEKLRLPELEPTIMCLELGDNSILYPLGIAVDVPVKVGYHFILVDFVVLEMGEREKSVLILGRPFLKTVGATVNVSNGEIKFDINDERSAFKFRPCFEVCNMINVKYVPPHRHFSKQEPRKKEEPEKKEAKEIKEVISSLEIKEQKLPVKTKKMTKPMNKPAPKPNMVQKWVPKIATPAKSIDPK